MPFAKRQPGEIFDYLPRRESTVVENGTHNPVDGTGPNCARKQSSMDSMSCTGKQRSKNCRFEAPYHIRPAESVISLWGRRTSTSCGTALQHTSCFFDSLLRFIRDSHGQPCYDSKSQGESSWSGCRE